MNFLKKLTSFGAVCLLACGLATSVYAHDAKVAKFTGSAVVQLPGENEAKPLTVGMAIPEGATIRTSPGSEVFLEVFPGGIATIAAESTVLVEKLALVKDGDTITSQEALLDLKKGNIVSSLDPTKKAINHYGVRTPKGVAAARGTVYTATVGDQQYTIVTGLSGEVTITSSGGQAVSITPGGISVNGGDATTADQLDADTLALVTNAASIAVSAVATVAGDSATFGEGHADTAAGELSAALGTIVQKIPGATSQAVASAAAAAPGKATAIVEAAIQAAADGGQNVAEAATAITRAAVQGAASKASSSSQVGGEAQTIATAAARAATAAAPNQVAEIAEGVAQAAFQGGMAGAGQANINDSAILSILLSTVAGNGTIEGIRAGGGTLTPGTGQAIINGLRTGLSAQPPPSITTTPVTNVDLPPVSPTSPVQ
jgi:hypothetical protein